MAQAAASSVNKEMETSMERLSTGLRINSAADDAAGVAIVSRMDSQIKGTNQAIRNAVDGQNMIDTAEAAHQEVEAIIQRIRELAIQSANDTNVSLDRVALNAEVIQLTAELDRISGQTTFNGVELLDGNFTNKQLQIGADARQVVSFDIDSTASASIGSFQLTSISHTAAANTIRRRPCCNGLLGRSYCCHRCGRFSKRRCSSHQCRHGFYRCYCYCSDKNETKIAFSC